MILAICIPLAIVTFVVFYWALEGWRLDSQLKGKDDDTN